MTLPGKQIHIRLTSELSDKLAALEREFGGVPRAVLLKLLMASVLEQPLERQVETITDTIRKRPRSKVAMIHVNSRRMPQ